MGNRLQKTVLIDPGSRGHDLMNATGLPTYLERTIVLLLAVVLLMTVCIGSVLAGATTRIENSAKVTSVLDAVRLAAAAKPPASAPADFFSQGWRLNPRLSHIYMQSVKKNLIFETHKFAVMEGKISKDGKASIIIELASLQTGVDLRDVRMRFLLFETFKFPNAEVTATLDKAALQDLLIKNRLATTLRFILKLHGVEKEIEAPVVITRIIDNAVSSRDGQTDHHSGSRFRTDRRHRQAGRGGRRIPHCSSGFNLFRSHF